MGMARQISAVILAGGAGKRMGGLSHGIQKCMLPIEGRPILAHIMENLLHAFGGAEVVIALGYKPDSVCDYFGSSYCDGRISIRYVYSSEQLETRRRLLLADKFLTGPFLYLAGDVISAPEQLLRVAESYHGYANSAVDVMGVISVAVDHSPAISHALVREQNNIATEMAYPPTEQWATGFYREMGIAYFGPKFIPRLKEATSEQPYLSHVISQAIREGTIFGVSTYLKAWYHFLRPDDCRDIAIHF